MKRFVLKINDKEQLSTDDVQVLKERLVAEVDWASDSIEGTRTISVEVEVKS